MITLIGVHHPFIGQLTWGLVAGELYLRRHATLTPTLPDWQAHDKSVTAIGAILDLVSHRR